MLRSVFHHLRDATRARPLVLDALKLACAAALFGSPWVFALSPAATWNLWVCGYAMLAISLAALVAEADWEPKANFALGAWVVAAPWILAFATDQTVATVVHMTGGGLISILSALELWNAERNPPWRFRPGAASRAAFAPTIMEWPQASAYQALNNPIFAKCRGLVPRQRFSRLGGKTANNSLRERRGGARPRSGRGTSEPAQAMTPRRRKDVPGRNPVNPSSSGASANAGGDSNAMPNRDPFDDLRPYRGDISGTGTDRPVEFQRKLPVRAAAGVMSVGPDIFGHAIRGHAATQERHGRTGRCPSHQRYDHKRGSTLEHAWSGPQWRDRMVERHQVAKAVASNSR
jgi:SPW repeat